jgi:holliday junction DNA helicase RuvA
LIARIRGKLVSVENAGALVELNGITYSIMVSAAVADRLISTGKTGEEVTFHIMHYIEGSVGMGNLMPRLVGFLNESDLEFFSLMISVQGLGVKKALKSLTIPVKDVAKAIELGDFYTLKKLPEIGLKTAQKMIVELKGKAAKFALLREEDIPETIKQIHIEREFQHEAVEILRQLQYSESEAEEVVAKISQANPEIKTSQELIQEIFKKQSGI